MKAESTAAEDYQNNYVHRLCEQNRELFDSDHFWSFNPEDLPLDPRRLFPDCQRTFLEIGFGHGEVLEEMIPDHPADTAFFGIERRPFRVRKTLKRLKRTNSRHSRLMRLNLELLRDDLFVDGAFDDILINHPDPWPKKKHKQHRLLNSQTVNWLAKLLAPGGTLEVASDHAEYFFTILYYFETDQRFDSLLPPPFYTPDVLPGRAMSRFEKHKRGIGETVHILRVKRI